MAHPDSRNLPLRGKPPLVSVITATYNCSATLRLTLASLLEQDFQDFEALIVGDACTDDSGEVVESFRDPRLIWINLPTNSGTQAAPNGAGLARARGEYVAYLGHDDLWFPWHLSNLLEAVETLDADLVHSTVAMVWPDSFAVAGPPAPGEDRGDRWISPSSILHRKANGLHCGGWRDSPGLAVGVDRDFIKRFSAAGGRIGLHPELGVLKFPSAGWGMYDLVGDPPQSAYLDRMTEDPRKLERAILNEFMVGPGVPPGVQGVRHSAAALFASVRRWVTDSYGRNNWPIPQILLWKYRRRRKLTRRMRGLTRSVDDNPG